MGILKPNEEQLAGLAQEKQRRGWERNVLKRINGKHRRVKKAKPQNRRKKRLKKRKAWTEKKDPIPQGKKNPPLGRGTNGHVRGSGTLGH